MILPILAVTWILLGFGARRLWVRAPQLSGRIGDLPDVFVGAFVAYALARYLTAPVEYLARLETLNILAYATIFWTCRYGITRRTHIVRLLALLAGIGTVVFAFALYLRLNPDVKPFGEALHKYYWPRFTGTYGCPNHFGGYLVMTTGVALSFGLFYRAAWPVRIFCLYLAVMMITGIVFSISRGSWLGLVCASVALLIFGVRHGSVRWFWPALTLAILVGMIGLFIWFSPEMHERIEEAITIMTSGAWENYARVQLVFDSFKIFGDYPLFGVGPATFVHIHPRYQGPRYDTLAIYTHNDYLNLLTDYGLVGFVLGIGFVVTATPRFFRYLGDKPDTRDRVILASAGAAWVALMVHSLVDFNMHIPANAMTLFALAGLGLRPAHTDGGGKSRGFFDKKITAKRVAVVAAVLAAAGMTATFYTARAYYPALAAELAIGVKSLEECRARLESAARADTLSPYAAKLAGDVCRVMAAQSEDLEKRYDLARESDEWYARAARANPLDDTITVHRAFAYDLMGRYQESYLLYQQAIKMQPYNGYFRKLLGLHLWRRGELGKAREAFIAAAECPHGADDAKKAMEELERILNEPAPAPAKLKGKNPPRARPIEIDPNPEIIP